jgi:MFS family permease
VLGRRPVYFGWVIVVALGITTIVSYGTTQYFFGVLVVPVQQETGWSRATISGAFSLGFVVAGVLGVPIGTVVDRRGARLVMSAGSLLSAACLFLLAQVHEVWQFYLLWAGGIGLSMALTFYAVTFTVVTNWFQRRRGRAMALLTLLGGLASPIFIPLAGWLVTAAGWRQTLIIFAACQLLIAFPLHVALVRRHPEDLGLLRDGEGMNTDSSPPRDVSLRRALAGMAFWTLTVSSGLGILAHSVLLAHQVAYMIGRGFDPVLAAGVAGLVGLASLPGRLGLNLLSERIRPQHLLALCAATQALGTAVLALASSSAWLWAYVVIYGAAFGAISPLRASVLADQFGRASYGAIMASQGVPVAFMAAAGPLMAGFLYDRLGGYSVALWITVAAFVASALGVALTPRPAVPAAMPSAPEHVPADA